MARRFANPWWLLGLAGVAGAAAAVAWLQFRSPSPTSSPGPAATKPPSLLLASGRRLNVWWDGPGARPVSAGGSNIHPADYAGPAACRECHPKNHQNWSEHPHQGMNALASGATVRGDFGGAASISYRGGTATFDQRDGRFRMRLERGGTVREYHIHQTIGVRLQQYYVGTLASGPEPPDHVFRTTDHVLPFGWLLDRKEWAPVVHIGPERPDDERPDPFNPPSSGPYFASYAAGCNYCHTTFPLGDLLVRRTKQMGEHAPASMNWAARGYLEESRPEQFREFAELVGRGKADRPNLDWEAPKYAVTLGVSCEACHLGSKEHAAGGGKVRPSFFPASPHLAVEGHIETGRTHDNVNWACGRCHTGSRPQFAAGMSTWNSVEYADAMRGSCYSKMRCVDCHEPHTAIGPKWTAAPERDDAVCLKCHEQYRAAATRSAHTHHPAGTPGDRCLNCHMPRINEGVNDVVRTHMIFSPTRPDMIHANQPNACNLCHTDRPIDWTLSRLKEWYGRTFDDRAIAASHPRREGPVALGWLGSRNESVRLVAAHALIRAQDRKLLPVLIDALDDPYLLNRQFATKGLEEMLGVRLADLGYRFFQTQDERRAPLEAVRGRFTTPRSK